MKKKKRENNKRISSKLVLKIKKKKKRLRKRKLLSRKNNRRLKNLIRKCNYALIGLVKTIQNYTLSCIWMGMSPSLKNLVNLLMMWYIVAYVEFLQSSANLLTNQSNKRKRKRKVRYKIAMKMVRNQILK